VKQGTKSKILRLAPGVEVVWLKALYVEPENRGSGVATRLLAAFLRRHRKRHVVLEAYPIPGTSGGPDAKALTRWYRRFGFVRMRGTGYNLMYKGPTE
jgi:GNAT superfamily N-acetyltransferase